MKTLNETNSREVYIGTMKGGENIVCLYGEEVIRNIEDILERAKKIQIPEHQLNVIKSADLELVKQMLTELYNNDEIQKAA